MITEQELLAIDVTTVRGLQKFEREVSAILTPDNYCCYSEPNAQVKWRDWAVDKYGAQAFWKAMDTVFTKVWPEYKASGKHIYYSTSAWTMTYAQPYHYMLAVCLCVIKEET